MKKNKKLTPKKEKIIYLMIILFDIIIIIYAANKNYANYVSIAGKKIFVGKNSKDIIFGKNYITLIITLFSTTYIYLINKYIIHKTNNKKQIIKVLLFFLVINCILFTIFTNKIY